MSLIGVKNIISSKLLTLICHWKGFSLANNHLNLAGSNYYLSSIPINMIEKAKKLAAFQAIDDHLKVVVVEIYKLVN